MRTTERKLAVVAIGGNSLIKEKTKPDIEHQWEAVRETAAHLVTMLEDGWRLVVTHGNGPQVGFILRRSELAEPQVHTVPLDLIGADTQGSIGYMLQQALGNEFRTRGLAQPVATIVTQVRVDPDDPAFKKPSKGIGGYVDEEQAERFRTEGWTVIDDAGRGLRRIIASPYPEEIIELQTIQKLADDGWVVIAVGGGGIPVIEGRDGQLQAAPPSVIDKDLATSLLARKLGVDLFVISTAVKQVALNYNTPDERPLAHMTLSEAKRYMDEGHFAEGSMKPKIEAVISFLEAGGTQALITNPENIAQAMSGKTGTWITQDDS